MDEKQELAETAAQVVYEYEGWCEEHISATFHVFEEFGEVPSYSVDELYGAALKADFAKKAGMTYDQAVEFVLKGLQ